MHLHSQGPARPRAEHTQPRQGGPAGAGAPMAAGWGGGCCWQCGPGPRHRGPVLQQTRPQRNPGLSVCSGPRWRVTTGVIVGVDLGCFAQTPGRSSGSPGSPGVGRSGVQRSGCGRPLSTQSRFKRHFYKYFNIIASFAMLHLYAAHLKASFCEHPGVRGTVEGNTPAPTNRLQGPRQNQAPERKGEVGEGAGVGQAEASTPRGSRPRKGRRARGRRPSAGTPPPPHAARARSPPSPTLCFPFYFCSVKITRDFLCR